MAKKHIFNIALIALLSLLTLQPLTQVLALTGSEFKPGKIISDSIFFSPGTMTAADIQTFLNAKVPACDTNGDQPIHDPTYNDTVTRKVYSERRGISAPFTCLRDFRQNIGAKAGESGLCNAIGAGNKSGADIIFEVAQACSINSRVLLVLLQKEQTLVTDTWPWPVQYRSATGYGCPDTAPCDAEYYGYFNQVYMAAWQFKKYAKFPNSYGHVANRNNNIFYNPNIGCSSSNVLIENQATAGLYNYTPYQPNQAALNNLYGTGDNCSAYGNRNFWRMYNDWFGSTTVEHQYAWIIAANTVYANDQRTIPYSPDPIISIAPGNKAFVTLEARNIGTKTWTKSSTFLGTSKPLDRTTILSDNSWFNGARIALQQNTVPPGETGTFNFQFSGPQTTGSYQECFNLLAEGTAWMIGPELCYRIDVVAAEEPNNLNTAMSPGQSLSAGSYLMSPSTHSMLFVQGDGNLALYNNSVPVWHTGTGNSRDNNLVMQTDGNLVLYSKTGQALWASGTSGNPNAWTTLQSDGNLVIYSAQNSPIWASGTSRVPSYSITVRHSLKDAVLFPHQNLQTASRNRKLIMQRDGNLVLYSSGNPVWASWTQNHPGAFAVMQADGNFVVYSKTGHALWASWTVKNPGATLHMQDDGNLVAYSQDGRPIWHTHTFGR